MPSSPTPTAAPAAPVSVPLLELTLTKLVLNAGLRLPYPFLATVAKGLGLSLSQTGRLLGTGELFGLAAFLVGRSLDGGRYRRALIVGLVIGGCGTTLIGFVHRPIALLLGAGCISLGTATVTTASHSLFGVAVPVTARARAVGLYETSWAFALLLGAPIAAVVIRLVDWSAPFIGITGCIVAMGVVLSRRLPKRIVITENHAAAAGLHPSGVQRRLDVVAIVSAIATSLLLTVGAVVVFSTFGPWLQDRHGFSNGEVGAVAFGFGVIELAASTGTARFTDRLGHRRATSMGAAVMCVGALALMAAQGVVVPGIGALLFMFGAFEFAYVSLMSVVAGVGAHRSGVVVGIDHTLMTGVRAGSAALGPWIYEHHGFGRLLMVSAALAASCSVVVRSRASEDRADSVPREHSAA